MAEESKKSFPLKNIALWTGWYFVASYFIFLIIFNFNILHLSDWSKILNIALNGFAGFTFGVALIAMIPIWLAGTITIIKTGKPLKFIEKKKEEKKEAEPEKIEKEESKIIFPSEMPEEMHVPYSRMIRGQLSRGAIDCKIPMDQIPLNFPDEYDQGAEQTSAMTIPENFDFDIKDESDAPVFKELSWGNNDETEFNLPDKNKTEVKIEIIGDKKFAVITHDDPDFWVADAENWFATGKQKPSPINMVIEIAKNENAVPVLLLKTENIMDLEILIPKWKADGIKIIKNITEL